MGFINSLGNQIQRTANAIGEAQQTTNQLTNAISSGVGSIHDQLESGAGQAMDIFSASTQMAPSVQDFQ